MLQKKSLAIRHLHELVKIDFAVDIELGVRFALCRDFETFQANRGACKISRIVTTLVLFRADQNVGNGCGMQPKRLPKRNAQRCTLINKMVLPIRMTLRQCTETVPKRTFKKIPQYWGYDLNRAKCL